MSSRTRSHPTLPGRSAAAPDDASAAVAGTATRETVPTPAAPAGARWHVHFQLGRVSNLPTVWSNVLAGSALATGAPPAAASVLLVAVAVSLVYIAGMYLNDAFDREVDAVERPERPIPSGRIAARSVFIWGFALLFAGWQLIALHELTRPGVSVNVAIAAGALAAVIVLYDAWHKGNPFGPALMGACRGLVYITAALAVAGALPRATVAGAIVLFAYTVGLTSVARGETGGRVRGLWPFLLVLAPLAYGVTAVVSLPGAVLYAAFLGWTVYALVLLRRPGAVGRTVVSLIAGMSLLDAVLIARAGLPGVAAAAALGFPLTLFLQRYVRGT